MRILWISVWILFCGTCAMAFEQSFTIYTHIRHDDIVTNAGLSGAIGWEMSIGSLGFHSIWEMRNFKIGDTSIYYKQMANIPIPDDFYFLLHEGYFWIDWDSIFVKAGFINLSEGVGNHYPLWIAPNSNAYPSVVLEWNPVPWFTLQTDFVFMRVGIDDWKTEGVAQYAKTLYYRRAAFRPWDFLEIGYEEALLFLGRSIDLLYAFSLFPYIGIQEVRGQYDSPWKEALNDNLVVGGYVKIHLDPVIIWTSLFIDDASPDQIWTPNDKIAWNHGVEWHIDSSNTISLEFAGSTKYNYQTYSQEIPPYQYVRYEDHPELPLEYNMIGYRYGPNSGVVNLEYKYHQDQFGFNMIYEYLVHGKRDPFAQWDEPGGEEPSFTYFPWLDDPVLQHNHSLFIGGYWNPHPQFSIQGMFGATYSYNYNLEQSKTHWTPKVSLSAKFRF